MLRGRVDQAGREPAAAQRRIDPGVADDHGAGVAGVGELGDAPALALDVELPAAVVLAVVDGVGTLGHAHGLFSPGFGSTFVGPRENEKMPACIVHEWKGRRVWPSTSS